MEDTITLDPDLLEKARLLRLAHPNRIELAGVLKHEHGYPYAIRYAKAADRLHRARAN